MKLGDKMTMDACNVWGGVCPRKCRPPRIGDIPKHGAVDEESPGSSSNKLTISPSDAADADLGIPLGPRRDVFPIGSPTPVPETFRPIATYEPRKNALMLVDKREGDLGADARENVTGVDPGYGVSEEARTIDARRVATRSETAIESRKRLGKDSSQITIVRNASREQSSNPQRNASKVTSSPEDSPEDSPEGEIAEVRKDSALFLEEAEGLPALREILKCRAMRIIRTRRESSGYASNLGTFDDDRRNSTAAELQQDLSSLIKDGRRQSAKRLTSRATLGRPEDNLADEANGGGSFATDRMPVCSQDAHRRISGAGLEMPNIEEVREVGRDEVSCGQESLDDTCGFVESIAIDELAARRRPAGAASNQRQATSSRDAGSRVASSTPACRERVVHQRSSPTGSASGSASSVEVVEWPAASVDEPEDVYRGTGRCFDRSNAGRTIDGCSESSRSRVERGTTEGRDATGSIGGEGLLKVDCGDRGDGRVLPRPVKVYQLLSTRSEDRGDGEPRLADRRTSLQISGRDEEAKPATTDESRDVRGRTDGGGGGGGGSGDLAEGQARGEKTTEPIGCAPARKLSSPGEVGAGQTLVGDAGAVTVRPIYPYCPYSPYGSPQGSPRNRRRPLRESRRVSIDNRQGALQLNQYKLLDNIGQGSYGIVKLAYNEEDETHYAMKILSKKKLMKKAGIFGRMAPGKKGAANPLAKVYREIALLKKLDHPNVVKLVEVLDDPDEDNLYLVFELVQRGEVLQIPTEKPLDEETARKHFRDVVMGVEYLHYQRIVHRDIKPSNLLVDSEGRVKIADLGVSAELRASGELLSGPAGTPAFAAPETTMPGANYSGTPCDVWSMGVTLYSLVTGRVPWDGAGSIIGVQAAVRSEPLKFPDRPPLSEELRDLVARMLAKDPAERIALPEVKGHRWPTNGGSEPLPSESDNCRLPVTVTDEEVERVVTRVPKLDTLILIKTMLKQHSFQNPFLPKKTGRTVGVEADAGSLELPASSRASETPGQREAVRNTKTDRFQMSGRSNSAPDSYDWQTIGRQVSVESPLPPVTEASGQESEGERR